MIKLNDVTIKSVFKNKQFFIVTMCVFKKLTPEKM